MNILIICGSFYPIQSPRSFRATELAKELVRQGHTITVATIWHESHTGFSKETGIKIEHYSNRSPQILDIKGGKASQLLRRGVTRGLDLFFHYPQIRIKKWVEKYLRESNIFYDAVISIAVPFPIHWGVAKVWQKEENRKAKIWIADCGDPFMHASHDSFPKMPYFHFLENKFLGLADFVTVPFEEMKFLFNQKYRDKLKVIPQGFKFEDNNLPQYKPNPVTTFIYAGVVMPGSRDPFSLVDYLVVENYDFRFVIYTRQQHQFSAYSAIVGSKLILKDYIPREALLKELARADFLVNVNTDSIDGRINAVPTKLIDYKISKRPILSYEQSRLPKKVIREFMARDFTNAFVDPNFDRYKIEKVAQQFIDLIP